MSEALTETTMRFDVAIKVRFDQENAAVDIDRLRNHLIEYIMDRVADNYDESQLSDVVTDLTDTMVESAFVTVR